MEVLQDLQTRGLQACNICPCCGLLNRMSENTCDCMPSGLICVSSLHSPITHTSSANSAPKQSHLHSLGGLPGHLGIWVCDLLLHSEVMFSPGQTSNLTTKKLTETATLNSPGQASSCCQHILLFIDVPGVVRYSGPALLFQIQKLIRANQT